MFNLTVHNPKLAAGTRVVQSNWEECYEYAWRIYPKTPNLKYYIWAAH